MNQEDIKYRQGRSKRQYEISEAFATWTFGGLVIIISILVIYNLAL
jgi:hypothetical protein